MKKVGRTRSITIATACVLALAPAARAASGTWDTTVSGSSWNTNGNWVSNVIANGSGNAADFNTLNITADTTVNLAVDHTIGNLVFGDTNTNSPASWTLAAGSPGGTLTLAGATPTVTVSALGSGGFVNLHARVDGTSGFTKAGSGMLILHNAANTLSGEVTLSGGILQLNGAALSSATTVAIDAGILVVATPNANAIGGTIAFGGGLLQYNNAPGTDYSSLFSTAANQNYRINTINGVQATFASNLSSPGGALTKTGPGTLTLAAANAYTGGTTLSAGTLVLDNAAASGSGPVTLSGNSTLQAGGAYTLANALDIDPGITGTLDTNGNDTTLSGALTGAGTLAKSGTGTLTLTGALNNTFSGAIQVNAGLLRSTDGTSFKNMTGAVTVAAGASFHFGQNFISGNTLTNDLALSGAGTDGNGALNLSYNATSIGAITLADDATISHDWNNATISGNITGIGRNLTLDSTKPGQNPLTINGNMSLGTGTLTKTGANGVTLNGSNSYGSAVIETGALYFRQTSAMGGSGANITIQDNGVAVRNGTDLENLMLRVNSASTGAVAFGGPATSTGNALDMTSHPSLSIGAKGSFTYSGTITPGGGNYRLGGGGGSLTVNSALTGSNGLIINDAQGGTVVLTGTRDYTGSTVVKTGTLRAHGTLNGAVSVLSGGTLAPGSASGTGSLALDQALTVDGSLSVRIDRAVTQTADLLTVPSLTLNGTLAVVNTGAALQAGDTFQLFAVTGSISLNSLNFDLPDLDAGLTWDFGSLAADGSLTVAVTGNAIGSPDFPELLSSQLQAVRDAGHTDATINPGTYHLADGASWESTFPLNNWSNFTVNADNVVFTVGKQRAFTLGNCSNIAIKGLTIRARYPSFTQGRVLGKGNNPDGKAYAIWRISDGYPTQFSTDASYVPAANEVRAGFAINAVNGTTGIIDHATGDNYNCILTPQGDNTWKVDFSNKTSLPFRVNDWLVTRLPTANAQSHAIFLNNSANCTIESVTSQGGGFATFFENGGGGNRLIDCRIECSPVIPPGGTELPVVSCSADGVHARDAYPGIRIENLVTTGVLLDDCIAIHGFFHEVTAVSGNTITVSSLGKLAAGDPVRISHDAGYFAQAVCTGIVDVGGGSHQLILDQGLPIPVGARVCNPKYDGDGFQIINCQLSGTRSRAIITKADNGLISGCNIRHAGAAIKIGPEYYWNESGYCRNVTVENTIMTHCRLGVYVNADGAMGNRNMIVRNNTFGTMSQSHAILLEGCDGATISGNSFGSPLAAETMRFEYSNDITLANNLVAHDPGGMNVLRGVANVTNLQGEQNGVLYSGQAYALTNSLSGLLLANSFSKAAGDPAQQYTECNASGRWILQPDGTGHARIISAANGLTLGVNDSPADGAPLVLEPDGSGDGQRWTLAPVGTSAVELANKLSGLSATVVSTATMETVKQFTGGSGAGQLWTPSFNAFTYASWASDNGVSFDPAADDDRDGIVNLLEYVLPSGSMATGGGTSGAITALNVEGQSDEFLTLAFQRRVAATDIVFNVEYSTDLSAWLPNAVLVNSTPNPDGTTSEMWRSPPITDAPSGFMRVRVKTTN